MKTYWHYLSLTLVIACGILLGYFVVRTYVCPLPRQYQLDFGDAEWIEPAEFAPVAYFRKEIFVSTFPEQAWVAIAAPDSFRLIVNGHNIGMENLFKTRVAGIYDIKNALRPGTNVIAASIYRRSYPGSAQLLLRGEIKESGAKVLSFVSDPQWRVAPMTGIVEGTEPWTSASVEEQLWPNAVLATLPEKTVHIDWVDTNPLVLRLPPSGYWIMADDGRREASFTKTFNASHAHQDAWIQVAGSGNLDLFINGHLITAPDVPDLGVKGPPPLPAIVPPVEAEGVSINPTSPTIHASEVVGVPSARPPSSTAAVTTALSSSSSNLLSSSAQKRTSIQPVSLQAYDISYWVKKGPNTILAAVRDNYQPASLLASGFVMRADGNPEIFVTDSTWHVLEAASTGRPPQIRPALEGPRNGAAPWGPVAQKLARPIERSDFYSAIRPAIVIAMVTAAVVAFWLLTSALIASLHKELFSRALSRDALLHAPVIIGLFFAVLTSYDYRFPQDWPFRTVTVALALLALCSVRLIHLFSFRSVGVYLRATPLTKELLRNAVPYFLLALIMSLGLALRYHNIAFVSFDHDEMGVVAKSKGVLKLGFPYSYYGGVLKPATTYELVSYPLALFGWIFGYSELAERLPACIMGTLTIGVLALMGRRLFNWRTGLACALIYACIPMNIRWAQNAFYPQQCQFLATLTFWFFYEAIRTRPLHGRFLAASAITFCATYLSWEGTAFILPALLVALIVVRWTEWWWLKEFNLYRCLFLIGVILLAQFCSRTYFGSPYLQVGFGLSNVKGPSLFFLTSLFQPLYYINKLLLKEDHVPFTLMLVAGLFFFWGNRAFRYVVTVLLMLILCHTTLLAALAPRYCYYYQPLLVLGGVAAAVLFYDRLLSLARETGQFLLARGLAHAVGIAIIAVLFIGSNESILKTYMLSADTGQDMDLMARLNIYRYDYRGAAAFVKARYQPGDLLIPGFPHVFEYYSGMKGDYFLNTLLHSKIPYNEKLAEPGFVDKFSGYPVIRNLAELEEVTHRGRRTWIIFAPYADFSTFSSPEVLDYLDKNAKVVFESYRAKVLLIEGASPQEATVAAQGHSG